jgi:hypothetical protein
MIHHLLAALKTVYLLTKLVYALKNLIALLLEQ